MSDAVRFPLVLGIISLCSAAGLALSYTLTRDEIKRQEKLKKARSQAEVLGTEIDPEADKLPWDEFPHEGRKGDPEGAFSVSEFTTESKERLYAAFGKAQGYSSKVEVVIAVDAAIEQGVAATTVKAMRVVKQLETPGLGSRCAEPDFQKQFTRLPYSQLPLVKGVPYRNPDDSESAKQNVAAITGATITSKAVENGVRMALARVRYHIEQKHKGSTEKPAEQPGE